MQSGKLLHYLHLHLIVFIWGFTAVLGALISLDAIPLVWYRMGLATVFLLFVVLIAKRPLRFPPKALLGFFVAGVIIAVHWLTFFGAIKASNVSVTLALMSTGAFFTAFLEPLFFKRRIIAYEVLLGLLVIVGLYMIFQAEGDYWAGMLLALCSAFLGALFSVINGLLVARYPAMSISFYELLSGVLVITLYLAFSDGFGPEFFALPVSDWWYLLVLALICTTYAFVASIHVMKWLSPYTVMLTINLEPVYGILLALVILGDSEYMKPQFYYGALVILLTVLLNGVLKTRRSIKKKTDVSS